MVNGKTLDSASDSSSAPRLGLTALEGLYPDIAERQGCLITHPSHIVKVTGIGSANHLQSFIGNPQPAGIAVKRGNNFYNVTCLKASIGDAMLII